MKVLCIKECSYSFDKLDYYFNIGDQFELSKIQPIYYGFNILKKTGNYYKEDKINIVIDFIDGKSYDVTVLKNDFTTLEQWRDNKIKELGI